MQMKLIDSIFCVTQYIQSIMISTCHIPAKSLQSRLTLCNLMDCSPPGSSVHGILQARILEWVAIPFSRGIFPPQGWKQHLFRSPALARWVLYH